jgi:H+-translocating NAD(P) transhydrogenase subunit alpha
MKVAVWRETAEEERRVALVPDAVRRLTQREIEVGMEAGAGAGAHIPDEAFEEAGATVGAHAVQDAEVVVKVRAPSADEVERLEPGQVLIGFLNPLGGGDLIPALASRKVTSFAMEAIPRTTRAQSMDALSSQATVAGYKAALIAAEHLGRFFPMLTTAAGTVAPAKVLVMGAGVAGLQAIATARRLGAIVTAFDVRSVVREQIESLGARFLEIDIGADAEAAGGYARALTEDEQRRQQDALAEAIPQFDAVITTALVPGKPAPKLVIADAVAGMKPGSVIVDLAGEAGGNCELTNPGKTVDLGNVIITAPLNLPATMPEHASQLYARNITSLLELMIGEEGELSLDFGDDIILGACITHDGEIIHLGAREAAPQEA